MHATTPSGAHSPSIACGQRGVGCGPAERGAQQAAASHLQVRFAKGAVEETIGLQHSQFCVEAEGGELVPQPRSLLVPFSRHRQAQERLEVLGS